MDGVSLGIEQLGARTIIVTGFLLLFIFAILTFLLVFSWKKEGRRGDVSLYGGGPMKLGVDVAQSVAQFVNGFISMHPGNAAIDFSKAAYCKATGRIFPMCVDRAERIALSWDILDTYAKGPFVSWGSLSPEEQGELRLIHNDISDFQTEHNSTHFLPQNCEHEYMLMAPGPLYVNRITKLLLGWQKVPGTNFEVLIMQYPIFQSIEETL